MKKRVNGQQNKGMNATTGKATATLPELTDELLMRQIQAQDDSALDEMYQRHHQRLENTIRPIIHDEAEVHDILQETLLQIWRESAHFSDSLGRPLSWMITIAKRRAIDRSRRRQAYARVKDRFTSLVTRQPNRVEAQVYRSDLRAFLDRHLQRLPLFQREAVQLAYFGGLSQQEIAVATKTPLGTIKTRLELGMRKLGHSVRPERAKV